MGYAAAIARSAYSRVCTTESLASERKVENRLVGRIHLVKVGRRRHALRAKGTRLREEPDATAAPVSSVADRTFERDSRDGLASARSHDSRRDNGRELVFERRGTAEAVFRDGSGRARSPEGWGSRRSEVAHRYRTLGHRPNRTLALLRRMVAIAVD